MSSLLVVPAKWVPPQLSVSLWVDIETWRLVEQLEQELAWEQQKPAKPAVPLTAGTAAHSLMAVLQTAHSWAW